MTHSQPREGSVGCPHAFVCASRLAPALAAAALLAPLLLAGPVRADAPLFLVRNPPWARVRFQW